MDPLNHNRIKEMQRLIHGFAVGTASFIKREGVIDDSEIQEAWQEIWAEYLSHKTKS